MLNRIKYCDLNLEIKNEIQQYLDLKKSDNAELTLEDATLLWFDDCFDEWILKRYTEQSSTKRKHFRLDIEIPVKVVERLIDSDAPDAEELDYVGTIVNISRGGFYFISNEHFNASSIIKVLIDLSSIDPDLNNVEALAMVVRSDRIDGGKEGVGVMFSSIYNGDRKNLDVFIFKNVAYHLSSGTKE